MSFRRSRGYRFLLLALSIVCLGGAGYIAYRTFFVGNDYASNLKSAEAAYQRGLKAYQDKNWAEAVMRFDEARLLAERARESLDTQVVEGKIPRDDAKPEMGKILWIKARAIRDWAYAKAHADGKPLVEPNDPDLKETYRSFVLIPDGANGDNRDRIEALLSLRGAAELLPDDPEVNKDAIRVEVLRQPIEWKVTEPLLRKAVQLNPKDPRAQFFLARYEFEQPGDTTIVPVPTQRHQRGWRELMANKSAERMTKANEHRELAQKNGARFWRSEGLKAEILYWTSVTGPIRKAKTEAIDNANRELDALLFTPQTGLMAAASRGDNLKDLGPSDLAALNWILAIGIDRAIDYALQPNGRTDRISQVVRAALDLSDHVVADPALSFGAPALLSQTIEVMELAQRFLTKSEPGLWPSYVERMDALVKKAPEAIKSQPMILWHLANITRMDALIAAKIDTQTPDLPGVQKLIDQSVKQAEQGLAIAVETKAPPAQIDQFHSFLAEWKLLGGVRSELIGPHLAHLRASASQTSRDLATYFEAVATERQGKLEKARKLLEPLTAEKVDPSIAVKANLQMVKLSLALNDPARALKALQELEPVFQQVDRISPEERVWAEDAVRDLNELLGMQARAHLGVAIQEARRFRKDNPGKPIPADLLTRHETAVDNILKKLDFKNRGKSRGDLMARLAVVSYLLEVGRRDVAETRLTELAKDYPDSVEVLRVRATITALSRDPKVPGFDPNGVAAADVLIQKFIKDYPTLKAARLFYAQWLMQTNRTEKAIAYLKDVKNFPDGGGELVDRLLAAALLQTGQREEAQKILSLLPPSPAVDLAILGALSSREGVNNQLESALNRYENQGRFRLIEARMRLAEGKFEEAIRGFRSAAEFTEVGPAARSLLPFAVLAYADSDPAKGREAAIQLTTEFPNEPGLYLAAALAALWMEEVGNADDKWEVTKSMYAGLNKWESVAQANGAKKVDSILTRVAFRIMAGDIDGARRDAAANLAQYPNHVPTIYMLAELALTPPMDIARARELYDLIVKEDPKYTRLPLLDAQIKLANSEWDAAAAVYEQMLKENPTNSAAYGALIRAREAGQKLDAALQAARDWFAKAPENPQSVVELIRLLVLTGKKAEAIKQADDYIADRVAAVRKEATTIQPPPKPAEVEQAVENARGSAQLAIASAFFRANQFEEAETRLRDVRKAFPNADRPALMLGDIAVAKKDWATAEQLYREILKNNRTHFVAGNNLAWILSEIQNKPAEALQIVEEIRRPRTGGRPIGAERLPADFLDTIGAVYVKLNRTDKFPEMQVLFDAATKRYPLDPRMFMFLAHAQAALGDKIRAMENYRTALRIAGIKNTITEEQNKACIKACEEALKKLSS
jgi:predicted Zn-dependent protease